MTPKELRYIKEGRHKARTDLFWFAKYVLGMSKIEPHVHQPLIDHLQQFPKQGKDEWIPEVGWRYTPPDEDPVNVYPDAPARRLILAPRSWYKTSINVIAHSMQWILNFPDITILIVHASQEVAEEVLGNIKTKFQSNNVMRYYFPEFCPPEGKDWGTQGKFNTPARKNFTTASTMSVSGIETIRTGMHYHLMKFTDIVDDKNAATKELCSKIIGRYGMARNLLISPKYWIDIEGTRYNYSDLYGRMVDEWIDHENKKEAETNDLLCFTMGCYKKDLSSTGKAKEEFTPDELELPYLLDAQGKRISRFPEEWPTSLLEKIRLDPITGEEMFASQQLNNPVETDSVIFSLKDLKWKAAADIEKIPRMYYITTVDFAHSRGRRSDNSVITTTMVDRVNRRYVVDIQMGKWSAEESIDRLFFAQMKYKPIKIKVEKSAYWSGLQPSILRKSQMSGVYPNWDEIQRPTTISKADRIEAAIQPWNRAGLLYFNSDLPIYVKEQLTHEWTRFPKYKHDDIMDTIADQFVEERMMAPLAPRKSMEELLQTAQTKMIENLDRYESIFGKKDTDSWSGLGAL